MENVIPWNSILNSPNTAWALLAIVLVIYVMRDGNQREVRLSNIIDGSLKEQTATLNNINTSLGNLNNAVCKTEERLDDIEDYLQINKVVERHD